VKIDGHWYVRQRKLMIDWIDNRSLDALRVDHDLPGRRNEGRCQNFPTPEWALASILQGTILEENHQRYSTEAGTRTEEVAELVVSMSCSL
jgi:hypothetical protein